MQYYAKMAMSYEKQWNDLPIYVKSGVIVHPQLRHELFYIMALFNVYHHMSYCMLRHELISIMK